MSPILSLSACLADFCLGEYEATIARSFVKGANLRALFDSFQCPDALKNCQPLFEKLIDPDSRNIVANDMQSFLPTSDNGSFPSSKSEKLVPEPIFSALAMYLGGDTSGFHWAHFPSHITINGLRFSVPSNHVGNSHVLIRHLDSTCPAQIEAIMEFENGDHPRQLLAVRHYQKLPPQIPDPFLQFPVLRTSTWSAERGQIVVVDVRDVDCHFACLPIDYEGHASYVTISLSRVSDFHHHLGAPWLILY